jgi:hypothetical protein
VLELAQVYLAGKHWDAATGILEHLAGSQNVQVAHAARNSLADIPTLKKYGRLPQAETPASSETAQKHPDKKDEETDSEEETPKEQVPAEPQPDRRAVQFVKGKLLSVDCSQSPVAVITVSTAKKAMKLRTDNYKNLMLVGADEFSCDWKSRPVAANYKAGGKADGDLVSLEVQ